MEAETKTAEIEASHEVLVPKEQALPLVLSSPHSGDRYPPEFVDASRLDLQMLRRSEDCFVDDIFCEAPSLGVPLLRALFPRAYVDPNREPFELDPSMFVDELPSYANTRSPRVAAGLGTIARVVANGADIYRHKLRFDEALRRIRRYYWPYHNALRDLIESTRQRFGFCILIDCHSMPSVGGPLDSDAGVHRVDFVLGDCHGTACASAVTEVAMATLKEAGYHVQRNSPYSGGFVTRHYGRPAETVHALQIEVNRGLYMYEEEIRRSPGLGELSLQMRALITALGSLEAAQLKAL